MMGLDRRLGLDRASLLLFDLGVFPQFLLALEAVELDVLALQSIQDVVV